ncbi:MAG: gliding motility protein GldN, partial [Tannerella sp.]|nr:gliding motility protein GldN [Tannerella sp.]
MKRYIIFLLTLALTSMATAQNNNAPRVSRGADRNNRTQQQGANATGTGTLSVRAQILNEQLTQEIGNAGWMRTVYRELDLLKEKNTPLYYPTQELNGSVNFFTSIFRLVSEGKIKIYRYLDGYEAFDDDNKLEFKDMLDNFNIFYEIVPASGNQPPRYIINSSDVPSGEVKTFLIKEAWYFDRNNSLFDVKTLAVCPIAYIIADAGGLERRMPMFWVKYEDIRPYVKNNFIMTSNLNNAKTFTVDDFFRRRMFEGDIVKTENLMNLVLNQYCPTPDSLEAERKRIENQLVAFNDSLWIKPDTTVVLSK